MDAQPKKVLVIEDDEVIVVLISHILARQSYVVHTTLDAFEADEMLGREDYSAILVDLRMPTSGVEFLRRLAERNPPMLRKVIVVTGAMDEAVKVADLPLHAVVRKPFEVGAFVATVQSCIDGNS